MGLITGLLTLPLAPVRGAVWAAERVLEQAEREYYDEGTIRVQLLDIDVARQAGTLAEDEALQAEDALVERMMEGRARGIGGGHG
jgi:hypothetical protein